MIVKQIIDEDFVNYKKASMFIAFPSCDFKCERECGILCCQNENLATSQNIEVDCDKLVKRYLDNIYTNAIVCGGLEPFDSWDILYEFVKKLRKKTDDDIVIYTGYNKSEIKNKVLSLSKYKNIIVKFGRFIPNQTERFDEVLGVVLKSENQYAERLT